MRIGFTCGSYDLLHAGHVMALQKAKAGCDWLIVGLQTNPTYDRPSKNVPIQTVEERRIQLLGCKYVDEIWEYTTEAQLYAYLWANKHRIDVRYMGADWQGKAYTGEDIPIHCVFTARSHNYSSSDLRSRIMAAAVVEVIEE